MDRIKCKSCDCYGMIPVEVDKEILVYHSIHGGGDVRKLQCAICKDDWVSIEDTSILGQTTVTFIHQINHPCVLKRVATVSELTEEAARGLWDYYEDDVRVDEVHWLGVLKGRRKILKYMVTN